MHSLEHIRRPVSTLVCLLASGFLAAMPAWPKRRQPAWPPVVWPPAISPLPRCAWLRDLPSCSACSAATAWVSRRFRAGSGARGGADRDRHRPVARQPRTRRAAEGRQRSGTGRHQPFRPAHAACHQPEHETRNSPTSWKTSHEFRVLHHSAVAGSHCLPLCCWFLHWPFRHQPFRHFRWSTAATAARPGR